jgi:hypothetical protein
VACPFFMPMEKLENGAWMHAGRLPLGCAWSGQCTAPGREGEVPSLEELRDFCNLGYAEKCARLPQERSWDSVRFGARTVSDGENGASSACIQIRYICERGHYPVEHGMLEFDPVRARWDKLHGDDRVQRMAECFLESYVAKKRNQGAGRIAS